MTRLSLHYTYFQRVFWFWSICLAFLVVQGGYARKEADSRVKPGLLTWPSKNTEAKETESVELTWRFRLTPLDMQNLREIDFGLCYRKQLNESLIKIKKFDENNSTVYSYNVTERYAKRLQWLGGADVVSFVLNNLTRKDTNSYIMVMSFGGARQPINDHFELIVTYPPKILNKRSKMEQMRFPEDTSVHLSCVVEGCPKALVTWFHDGRIVQSEKDKSDLTISKGKVSDSGVYRCEAVNNYGKDYKEVLIIVTSCNKKPNTKADTSDDPLAEANSPNTMLTMIAPAVVFFVIFTAYFFFRCPAYRNKKKRNKALLNSKATSTPALGHGDDEQATSLLADWSNYNDRGEKV